MDYKSLKIDMDYCADPVWVSTESEDNPCFANGSLTEFEGMLSKELLHGLRVYQLTWEAFHWSDFKGPGDELKALGYEDNLNQVLQDMEVMLAVNLKSEVPECRVYFSRYYPDNSVKDKFALFEVNEEGHVLW